MDAKTRTFSAWSHVVAMLYAQLTHAIGLNDVCDGLRHHGGWLARIRGATPPSRNGFSHANKVRDAAMAEQLFWGVLAQYQEFREFKALRKEPGAGGATEAEEQTHTPEEVLEHAYQNLRGDLAADLLSQIKQSPPAFFERLVVELLVKMGYGGSRKDAGRAIGKSGDEGIDGIIKEDRLGLDIIYLQAKRWDSTVGRPEIQKFAGALQGQRARKGIFITTSDFSRDALEYPARIDSKILLIDGEQLAQLLIDHDIGVALVANYAIKRVDSDYFTEQ